MHPDRLSRSVQSDGWIIGSDQDLFFFSSDHFRSSIEQMTLRSVKATDHTAKLLRSTLLAPLSRQICWSPFAARPAMTIANALLFIGVT